MVGNDVAVLQLNLDIHVDGDFGAKTEKAVTNWQENHGFAPEGIDGVAGPDTQRSIIVLKSRPATEKYDLPAGILKSIAFNESGFILSAAGPHSGDAGWDVGAFCRSSGSTPPTPSQAREFFNVTKSADWTANHLIVTKSELGVPVDSSYLTDIGENNKDEFAWQLAILAHNWPYAADNIADRGHIFNDPADDDQPANWIIIASGGRLSTPRQWVTSYIEKATGFVKWRSI